MWNESNEYSPKNWCVQCKKVLGVHEINFNVWMCRLCFSKRQQDIKAPHVNWAARETVDTLLEGVYYMASIHKDKPWQHMYLQDSIKGDKGIVCYTVDEDYFVETGFGFTVAEQYRYFVLYNKRYLSHGDSLFDRASMYKGDWQTVRKDILDKAADLNETKGNVYRNKVSIAIVMQNKGIWYIDPSLMRTFSFEYETERIPYNEISPECSIPISKEKIISRHDPFPPTSSHANLIKPKTT